MLYCITLSLRISQERLAALLAESGDGWAQGVRLAFPDGSSEKGNKIGSALMGSVTATFFFFDRGTFWVLLLTYFCLRKSARGHFFPQPVKTHYFCSGPINVEPICPQPRTPLVPDDFEATVAELLNGNRCRGHTARPHPQ